MTYNPYDRRRYNQNGDILLQLLRLIASKPLLYVLLSIWQLIAILGIVILTIRLENYVLPSKVVLPDVLFMGYTSEKLYNEFYNVVDTRGCEIYSTLALWDMFILVPAYTLVLGTIYVYISRQTYDVMIGTSFYSSSSGTVASGYWNADQRAYLILPIAVFDIIETTIQRRGCTLLLQQQAVHLSDLQVRIASTSVSLKWSFLALFFISIVERIYRGCARRDIKGQERMLPLWM